MLKITIRSAKNDQLALGRDTFVDCQPGSTLELLLLRWRINNRSEYVFPNLHNWTTRNTPRLQESGRKHSTAQWTTSRRKEEVQEEEVQDPHEEHSYAFKLAV
ncbi:hypothetical protein CRE_23551 [Caenorhabditis remanei]|uniref:Uncharacterized protein n=1 Tax=Caenorhabditis remanei TaxID=31234 RepID=E3MVR6_CAERE|nr:hypothetical protein CRE_23551 [Caenorhabditis remanei]